MSQQISKIELIFCRFPGKFHDTIEESHLDQLHAEYLAFPNTMTISAAS